MSVFIKGFEKPKNCHSCPFNQSDCSCRITKGEIDRDDYSCSKDCPIVTVPFEKVQDFDSLCIGGQKNEDNKMIDVEQVFNLFDKLESLRIDVEAETAHCDPTRALTRAYERGANDMLNDCIIEFIHVYRDVLFGVRRG